MLQQCKLSSGIAHAQIEPLITSKVNRFLPVSDETQILDLVGDANVHRKSG